MEEIDNEMTEKLSELRDIMAQVGLQKSTQFINENMLNLAPQNGRASAPSNSRNPKMTAAPNDCVPGKHLNMSRNCNKVNRNNNHKKYSRESSLPSKSVETIYRNAVEKHMSSSSEEGGINTSDELMDFIADENEFQPDYEDVHGLQGPGDFMEMEMDVAEPGPSQARANNRQPEQRTLTPEEKVEKLVIEAENTKAQIFPNPGRSAELINVNPQQLTAMMDEDYLVVGGHIDEGMETKIVNGEYVDFGKLLPCNKIIVEEDNRLELVIKNGKTFWLPVSESVSINNFSRWEQAFRIYSNVYTRKYPHKSTELIQYNHIIHTIAGMYTWENVYSYDKEFRLHLSKHPSRNWSIILQQVWSMKLKDRLNRSDSYAQSSHGNGNHVRNENKTRQYSKLS